MTLRELFSEWSNPQDLFKGAIISAIFCVVFLILYILDNNRGTMLGGALALTILHIVCRFRLSIINKNK